MPVNFSALTAVQAAEMFGVSEKTIRNWMNDNGLPCSGSGRGRTIDAAKAIQWHHEYTAGKSGNGGRNPPAAPAEVAIETIDQAMLRKTVAEADLKELQLAKERGQVAAIGDVEKLLSVSNLAVQTQLLAVPSRLATQMLGIEEHGRAVIVLEAEMRQVLSNLASIDAVREAAGIAHGADAA